MPTIRMTVPEIPRHWYEDKSRSTGLHLSSIISRMAVDMGILYADLDEEFKMTWQMCFGLAWEAWYFKNLKLLWQPGEFHADGIAMSPDGIEVLVANTVALHECKTTKKKLCGVGRMFNDLPPIDDQWLWFTQMKGYIKGLRVAGFQCNTAVLHVLFINGNYKFNDPLGGFQLRRYTITFTDLEIEENWEMILNNKPQVVSG